MERFSKFINLSNLIDTPSRGMKFRFFSGDGTTKSSIDRFLVTESIIDIWGMVGQVIGTRDILDHCLIWLMVDNSS